MSLRAGLIVLALAFTASAQAPRSPVIAAISSSAPAGAQLPELIRSLNDPGRRSALAALDALDRPSLDSGALLELSQAYGMLGRPGEAVKVAAMLSTRDAKSPAGDKAAITALTLVGDYRAAQKAAENALKRFPRDKDLLGLWHQVKDRVGAVDSPATASMIAVPSAPGQSGAADSRPFVLPVRAGGSAGPPPLTRAPSSNSYLFPGSRKPSQLDLFLEGLLGVAVYGLDRETPLERERMAALRNSLEATETGRALIADLGGWKQIERDVDVRFVWMRSGTGAYVRPLAAKNAAGQRFVLAVNKAMMKESDAIAVPILAHELSHVRDHLSGSLDEGLHIPSELSAHRTEIHVFKELQARLTPGELADLKRSPAGRYQIFIAMLWEDRLAQRFKSHKDMARETGDYHLYHDMSQKAFEDLRSSKVEPGSPQLDHHLNGESDGLYRILTAQRDVIDLVSERGDEPKYGDHERERLRAALAKRELMMAAADKRDMEFRKKYGFEVGAK